MQNIRPAVFGWTVPVWYACPVQQCEVQCREADPFCAEQVMHSCIAGRLVEAEELTMSSDGTFDAPGTMFPVTRPIGSNDVGVVAWLLTLKTPECPQGRQVCALPPDKLATESQCITIIVFCIAGADAVLCHPLGSPDCHCLDRAHSTIP